MNKTQAIIKRTFDIIVSLVGIVVLFPLMLICFAISTWDTKSLGIFMQKRVGLFGKTFTVIKIKTMRNIDGHITTVTSVNDPRITTIGRLLRKYKLDELPQLFNVLSGSMSFVGPRPDVPGFADELNEEDSIILTIRPGITGLATLKLKNEESILEQVKNQEKFNREVLFPLKVAFNLKYLREYSFRKDIDIILQTVCGSTIFFKVETEIDSANECVKLKEAF
ncbi:sugar transferase [Enterovibrio norvegicus]|uniref:Sugar transferase n=1 Tax=Enterovibrio norvegicus TaxID=188144 RepID=A0ABV4KWB9_9GAMM|nr:sugar transferase [Enterovibrio norvegicus]OEF58802.1 sugar transferase [Enterovibrio norvegicus]